MHPTKSGRAKNFLEGLLLYVRTAPLHSDSRSDDPENEYQLRERSMREVRRLLSLDKEDFESLLSDMGNSKRTLIRQAGNNLSRLMSGHGKTGQSILAIALEQTSVWAYQRLHKVTYKPSVTDSESAIPTDLEPAQNDFSFKQLRDGKTSIYLIIPPDYLTEYRAVLRVMIGFAMRELRQSFVQYKKSYEHQDKPPILFILDEFPQLAYMRPIEEALLYLAGYDVRFWFFVQDISQLQLHYKDSWQTFFANTGTQCFFGVSDIATANLVSERAGTTTVRHTSKTYSPEINSNEQYRRPLRFYLKSETDTDASRPLITPDEVTRLYDDEQIVFIKGIRPIRCYRPNYYNFRDLKEHSEIKPPHEIDFL
jgi:type IV secretion system protein VirD4